MLSFPPARFAASTSADAGSPRGISMMRFSTPPFSATMMASARVASMRTNSTCFSRTSCFAASTTPAPRDRPESMWLASDRSDSTECPSPAAFTSASMRCRSSSERSPTSISESIKKRSPSSVGSRPALVCGA